MTVDSTIEFSVNFAGPSSVQETEDALKGFPGIRKFKISLKQESLTVTTTLPTAEVQKRIEAQTGLRAVVVGMGGDKEALPGKTKGLGAAVAAVGGALGAGSVQGVVRFVQLDSDNCLIDGTIDGLTPGEHALAVHECGDLSGGCQSVGPHFNPRNARHGSPVNDMNSRHVGDLGNVTANSEGVANFKITDKLIKVWDIIGRSVVVAEGRDDYGLGGHPKSEIDGNCGVRLSCGIIARSAGLFENSKKKFCACDGVTIWEERDKPVAGEGRSSNSHTENDEKRKSNSNL